MRVENDLLGFSNKRFIGGFMRIVFRRGGYRG